MAKDHAGFGPQTVAIVHKGPLGFLALYPENASCRIAKCFAGTEGHSFAEDSLSDSMLR